MAKKGFDLADAARRSLGENVSDLDIDTEVLRLPVAGIDANEANFYSMTGIDELAASIELTGLLHPIIVKTEGERWRLIDGERRFNAVKLLGWETVPCIVRKPASSVLEELMLIEANRQQRTMSAGDLSKQLERYYDLLAELKRSGLEIPGRLRTAVAEAFQISESKVARLAAIRKNLIPALLERFDAGEINESSAYELSRCEAELQEMFVPRKTIAEWQVRNARSNLGNLRTRECGNGQACVNLERRLDKFRNMVANDVNLDFCYGCCLFCWRKKDCEFSCRPAKEKAARDEYEIAKAREEYKRTEAEQQEREKTRRSRMDATAETFWGVVRERAEALGLAPVGLIDIVPSDSFDVDEADTVMGTGCANDEADLTDALDDINPSMLPDFAADLGCTVGELFGEKVSELDTDGWHITETDGRPSVADAQAKILLTLGKNGAVHVLTVDNLDATFDIMSDWCVRWRLVEMPYE